MCINVDIKTNNVGVQLGVILKWSIYFLKISATMVGKQSLFNNVGFGPAKTVKFGILLMVVHSQSFLT